MLSRMSTSLNRRQRLSLSFRARRRTYSRPRLFILPSRCSPSTTTRLQRASRALCLLGCRYDPTTVELACERKGLHTGVPRVVQLISPARQSGCVGMEEQALFADQRREWPQFLARWLWVSSIIRQSFPPGTQGPSCAISSVSLKQILHQARHRHIALANPSTDKAVYQTERSSRCSLGHSKGISSVPRGHAPGIVIV